MSAWEGSQMQMDKEDRLARCRRCTPGPRGVPVDEHSHDCPAAPRPVPVPRVPFTHHTTHVATLTPAQLREIVGAPKDAKVELLPLDSTNENGTVRVTWST